MRMHYKKFGYFQMVETNEKSITKQSKKYF